MAKIINVPTLDGSSVVYIVAPAVSRVLLAPPDATGAAPTQIDIGGTLRLTNQPVAQVAAALTAAGVKLVQLTALNGASVSINAASVSTIRSPTAGEYPADAKSVVSVGGHNEAFKEAPAAIMAML
jgi:hypothetical protein